MNKYQQAEKNRQDVIDYLKSNPGCIASDIVKAVFSSRGIKSTSGTMESMLKRMVDLDELHRELVSIKATRKDGQASTANVYHYWALVDKTTTAHDMVERVKMNAEKPTVEKKPRPSKKAERILPKGMKLAFSNTDENRMPIRNPDAMGSSGIGWGIGSSLGSGVCSVAM